MTYEIEDGFDMPENRGSSAIYPWHKMEIGQSFFVDGGGFELHNGAYMMSKRHSPKKFVARKVDGGMRVWRIK